MLLPSPLGLSQLAFGFHSHQAPKLFKFTGPSVASKTNEAARSKESFGFGVFGGSSFFNCSQLGFFSAVVT